MVKWHIDTIYGAISVIVIDVATLLSLLPFVSHVQSKTQPMLFRKLPKTTVPLQAPAGHHRPIATATMAMLHRRQPLQPLSWPPNQDMQTTLTPVSLMHWEHDISGEGGGGDVGGVMVQRR
eukprot:13047845-Ditylum_brightwellii.AAC.1